MNRLSSDERPLVDLTNPDPEAVLLVAVLVAVEGLDGGLLVGGALAPLIDLVKVGARGKVSGFGRVTPLEVVTFVAVLDG